MTETESVGVGRARYAAKWSGSVFAGDVQAVIDELDATRARVAELEAELRAERESHAVTALPRDPSGRWVAPGSDAAQEAERRELDATIRDAWRQR